MESKVALTQGVTKLKLKTPFYLEVQLTLDYLMPC